METAGRELAVLQTELEEATQQVENAQHVLQTRQLERRKVEGEMTEARQKLSGFTARQAHLEARQVEGQTQLERRRIALQEAIQAGELAQVEQRQLSEKASSLQNVLHDCENARQAVETELEAGRQQVLAIEQTRRKAQEV